MKHIFKIFLGLCVALAITGPAFVGAQFGDCPLSCPSGQVCEINPSGAPQCVAEDPFPQDCPLSCSAGQVCERDAGGTPRCVAGQPDPSGPPDPGSTYNPPNLPINTNLPISGAVPISGPDGQGPAGLIANFYSFAFLIAGFLAFVMIVYGGVRYTFSGGNHSAKEEAKEAIRQALIGLGLLLVAYLILRTINPDLTKLQLPTLEPYTPVPVATGPTTTTTPGGIEVVNCASGPCVTVVGTYIWKNGRVVDQQMANVLHCMLGQAGVPPMRITEAMPPSSPHQSTCHNNGCCVDMTLQSQAPSDCPNIQAMLAAARACGATRVLNEYFAPISTCGGANTELSTGVHIHVAAC